MKRVWTIIGVADVPDSVKWYQALFGQPATLPAHDYFGQILDADGTVLLCLHQWGAHEHPSLTSPDHATPGNGLLLFFRVDDFEHLYHYHPFEHHYYCHPEEAFRPTRDLLFDVSAAS